MFAVLHIADFALHAVLRTEAAWTGGEAALFADTSKKSVVLAITESARAAGVELGMTAPQAVARCPALTIRAARAAAEEEARAALLAVAFTVSPAIEDTAPGVCTIDLKGLDSARHVAACQAAVTELAHLGLPTTAGIACTPLLALYAARGALDRMRGAAREPHPATPPRFAPAASAPRSPQSPSASPAHAADSYRQRDRAIPAVAEAKPPEPGSVRSQLQLYPTATSATERASPPAPPSSQAAAPEFPLERPNRSDRDVSPVLHVTDPASFLAPLPLSVADPSPELSAVLHGWGLRTLGDLTALPRDEIVRRFGAEGLALWQRAAGGKPRPLHPVTTRPEFSAAMALEDAVETLEPLLFLLRRFLDRLTLELRASQHVAVEIELRLKLEDDTAYQRGFRLPEPTADPEILFRTLHTHLESLTTAAAIVGLALRLTPARPLVRQQGLFETGLRDPHGFAETLARVSALVGADRVGTPQLVDTHRPDAVKLAPPLAVVPPPAEPPLHPPLGPPLRRFRPPLPARLEFTDGRPTYLWTEHLRGEVVAQGPAYPSAGDWWQQDRAWARTEWDIALAEGGLYRLLRVDQAWFIEGEYD